MFNKQSIHNIEDIEFTVKYSRRRTIAISINPDTSVTVRVPYLTMYPTISRIVNEKANWIRKHRDSYRHLNQTKAGKFFSDGEKHLYRGNEVVLKIEKSVKPFVWFSDGIIDMGLAKPDDPKAVKRMLYTGYKREAGLLFPELLNKMLIKHENQNFKPAGLTVRSMKRRWGSCSNKGMITLSTELIKLGDRHIEYVIVHELCHLRHHNHSSRYYELLSELFPGWKEIRKEMKTFTQ